MKKINNFLKNENGFALVTTFLIMLIIITLVTVLINISLTEFKSAERSKKDTKAYYLARSGADVVSNLIIDIIKDEIDKDISEIDNIAISSDETPTSSNGYTLKSVNNKISYINIIKNDSQNYDIISTANVGNVEKSISVNVKNDAPGLFDSSIFAKTSLDFSKMDNLEVYGYPVETAGNEIIDNGYLEESEKITNSNKSFQSIEWDTNDTIQNLINAAPSGGKTITNDIISESGYFDDISYNKNSTLTFDFQNKNTINLAVETMSIKGELEFVNNNDSNHLNIFVNESITFQTPNVSIPNINILLMKDTEITLIANSDLPEGQGIFVYGPEANMIMQSNQTSFKGGIIVDSFEGQGNLAMGSYYYQIFSEEDQNYINNVVNENTENALSNWIITDWKRFNL